MVTRQPDEIRRYPFVAWRKLKPAIDWKQGQHVLTVGGTGSGKSTLAGELLPRRSLVVVAVSKGKDAIFDSKYYRDYTRRTKWPPSDGDEKVLLWPNNGKTLAQTRAAKRVLFEKLFDDVLLHRGFWCIDVDEVHYMSATLKLEHALTDTLEQGRSAYISLFGNTQRPSGISLAWYVNCSHFFFFLSQEEYDVRRLRNLNNAHTNADEMMANIQKLNPHEFIYIDKSGKIPPVRSIVS